MNLSGRIIIRGYATTLFLLIALLSYGQSYRYITVDKGLSSRRVYSITKDREGYMWFLTNNGIDRYNGKEFKNYPSETTSQNPNFPLSQDELKIDEFGILWGIGKNGTFYKYDSVKDKFDTIDISKNKILPPRITYTYLGPNHTVWLCNKNDIYLYDVDQQEYREIRSTNPYPITEVQHVEKNMFYIGTERGLFLAHLSDNVLKPIHNLAMDTISIRVQKLYYSASHQKLLIGTLRNGVYLYDLKKNQMRELGVPKDIQIMKFAVYGSNYQNILIATFGAGIYKYDLIEDKLEPFLSADYTAENKMNGNNINEIYVDEKQRVWASVYPMGVTLYMRSYPDYNWIRHAINNTQTIANNQVNYIIQDSDGDLWYATNDGISLYRKKDKSWEHYLSNQLGDTQSKNHIYLTLCEIKPGIIMTGGYMSGFYWIDKKEKKTHYLTPNFYGDEYKDVNKYVRVILKDKEGYIWAGGYNKIEKIDWDNKKYKNFKIDHQVTCMAEKDEESIWVGTTDGLYRIEKETGKISTIDLPVMCKYISAIYQDNEDNVYIGTCGSGLLIYNLKTGEFISHRRKSCTLLANNIYAIVSNGNGDLLFSTEGGITRYFHQNKTFYNWTSEQGLISTSFNYNACLHTRENTLIFGSDNGAIEFSDEATLPYDNEEKIVFSNFRTIPKKSLYFPEEKSISIDINKQKKIKLPYSQNIFSFHISSINYESTDNVLYCWKIEGLHNKWSTPSKDNIVQYTNLSPGKYILRVRSVMRDNFTVLDEKAIEVDIAPPFWGTIWAKAMFALMLFSIGSIVLRYFWMKREKRLAADKVEFYINTAHDIRTPLTLIKVPLEELIKEKGLSDKGKQYLNMALRKTNELCDLISNTLAYEKSTQKETSLYIRKYDINDIIEKSMEHFMPYAVSKKLTFTYTPNEKVSEVWIDKDKINSILQNLISNALKYTNKNGRVEISILQENDNWGIRIQDTGIGIPEKEQKELFNLFFRASNAAHIKDSTGIGLNMVQKLVKSHKGFIQFESTENKGSTFTVFFPIGYKYYKQELIEFSEENKEQVQNVQRNMEEEKNKPCVEEDRKKYRIIIVEDNDEMRLFLDSLLSETYTVFTTKDGLEGWRSIKKSNPDLVISDIMMPGLSGDKLCKRMKEDIETSHIPIILLTALGDAEHVVYGLSSLADSYMAKPFNAEVLHATIKTLIRNRSILKDKFAKFSPEEEVSELPVNASDLDVQFMKKVKEIIEMNLNNSDFTVDGLAALLNMSRSSFFKKLKNLTDQAPNTIIRNVRLNKAAELLWEKHHTVAEVSDMTGFSDVKYFRKLFKKRFGCTPSEYAEKGNRPLQ